MAEEQKGEGSNTQGDPSGERARTRRKQVPFSLAMIAFAALVAALSLAALCLGRFHVDPATALGILASPFDGADASWTVNEYNTVMNVRLPRVLAAILVGAALGLSGAAYQGVFRNPLVSPDILGVSHGACVGAAVAIIAAAAPWQVQVCAFVGGIAAVALTTSIPRFMHRRGSVVMVLAGVVVGGFMSSVIGLLKYVADSDTQLPEIVYWQLGSIAKVDYETLAYTAPAMFVAGAVVVAMRWRINVLSLGENEARSLGIDVRLERGVVIVAATVLTACAVSLSGTIGWVGLIVPHVARGIVGQDNRRLIPATALAAAAFMLAIDTIARCATGFEIPLGVLTGLVGAPVFAFVLSRQKDVD